MSFDDHDDDPPFDDDPDASPAGSPPHENQPGADPDPPVGLNLKALQAQPGETYDFSYLVTIRDAWQDSLQRTLLQIQRSAEYAGYTQEQKALFANAYNHQNRISLRFHGKRRGDPGRIMDFDAVKSSPQDGWYQLRITSPLVDLIPTKAPPPTTFWGQCGSDVANERTGDVVDGYQALCADLRTETLDKRDEAKRERVRAEKLQREVETLRGSVQELQALIIARDQKILELEASIESSDRQLEKFGQGFGSAAKHIGAQLGFSDVSIEAALEAAEIIRTTPNLQAYLCRRSLGKQIVGLLNPAPEPEEEDGDAAAE